MLNAAQERELAYVVIIDGLRFPRLRGHVGKLPSLHKRVDKRGFPHSGFAGEGHLWQRIHRQFACRSDHRFEAYGLYFHALKYSP